jgi:hypothetical protein
MAILQAEAEVLRMRLMIASDSPNVRAILPGHAGLARRSNGTDLPGPYRLGQIFRLAPLNRSSSGSRYICSCWWRAHGVHRRQTPPPRFLGRHDAG